MGFFAILHRTAATLALVLPTLGASAAEPRLRIGWHPLGMTGTQVRYELRIISADAPSVEPDTMSLDVRWPEALVLAGEPEDAIPAEITKDYDFFADPLPGLPAGTTGRRISVFRSGTGTRPFTTGDGIAAFTFVIPEAPRTVSLDPDPAGGVFRGTTLLDPVTSFDALTIPPGGTATPTPTVTPTPFPLAEVIDSVLRRITAGADANGDGPTDAADAVTVVRGG